MSFFCRSDISPLFRLLDDYETHRSGPTRTVSFTPSFDVREGADGYYLDGELPGVDQSNIEIEFSDPQTLVVKGHTERNYQSQPQTQSQGQIEGTSSPRHQATVEDEADSNTDVDSNPQKLTTKSTKQTQPDPFHFWASERSIGEFQRTFAFNTRVDQDGVRASLKNGILSIYVPKDAVPKTKKIRIQ